MIPIILLAFANDKRNTGAGYLRGLTTERNAIRDALMKAEENGLCHVLVEPDATVDRLFDIFQNSTYRDRIAVFHYGGHAESYSLLLETASGDKATAHSEGLVTFLAKQKSLKLVFLNGCSSQKQSQELVAAGLPAVIGTSQTIDDAVATGLATRFYKGLSSGMAIERAWTDAIDQIKTEKGTGSTKVFFSEGILGSPGENVFPWELYTGEGGELSKAWNLPEAANQPLFGLELPKSYYRKLPLAPYVGLRSFKREEAAIFFGRGADIRKVHTQLRREQPVILLTGKKGVGKSSLLNAGLAPRLESEFIVSCISLDQQDLTDSFSDALEKVRLSIELEKLAPRNKSSLEEKMAEIRKSLPTISGFAKDVLEKELEHLIHLSGLERFTFHEQWLSIEEKTGKPMVMIIDELPADAREWQDFVEILVSIFEAKNPPRGKLVLSIDEEYQGAFCELLEATSFPYAEIFLEPLTWDGLQEAVAGITLSPVTKEFYRLQMEHGNANNFKAALCSDLADGDSALVAPYLQFILLDLWKTATKTEAHAPAFTMQSYHQGIQSGEIMDKFLKGQLALLKDGNAAPVQSGLALDLLYLHTSALGKSEILEAVKRKHVYGDRLHVIDKLVKQYRDLFLLTAAHTDGTNLGHNLLAPVVIRHYSISLSPGQQAARILNAKGSDGAKSGKSSWLSEADLEIVEKGIEGMRSLTGKEEALLKLSREKKLQAQKERKRRKLIRGVFIAAVMVFAILAAWQWQQASQRYLYARAGELAFKAKEVMEKDNTLAVNIARQAYAVLNSKSPPEVIQTLSEIFHSQESMPFYASKFLHAKKVNTAVFSPDGKNVLTASEDGLAKLWDLEGHEILSLPHEVEVLMARFSPNGEQILTLTRTDVFLWEKDNKGTLIDKDTIPESTTNLDSISTDGMKIIPMYDSKNAGNYNLKLDSLRQLFTSVIASPAENRFLILEDSIGILLDGKGQWIKSMPIHSVTHASFSDDGMKMMMISPASELFRITVWTENGDSLYCISGKGEKVQAVFSPDGLGVLATLNDYTPTANSFTARLWIFTDLFLHQFPKESQAMNTIDFFPDGNRYLTACADGSVRIWNEKGRSIDSLWHNDFVSAASFSLDGKHIITASRDYTARVWTPTEPLDKQVVVLPHRDEVSTAVFSKDDQKVLTASRDSLVRLWSLDGTLLDSFLHPDARISWAGFSHDNLRMVSISSDNTATLWDVQGDSLHIFRHPDRVTSVAFSPDDTHLLTSCSDSLVRMWTVQGELVHSFRPGAERPRMALFTDDGKYIITGGKVVKIWDLEGELLTSLPHTETVAHIAISPDGEKVLTSCNDHNAYLWSFEGELLAEYEKHTDIINRGMFTPDGSHILTASNDGTILRWKTPQAIFTELNASPIAPLSKSEQDLYSIESWSSPYRIIMKMKSALLKWWPGKEQVQSGITGDSSK